MQETQEMLVQSLSQKDPLKKETAIHSSILAWKILWTEEPGRPQSMWLQIVRHDWAHTHISCYQCWVSLIVIDKTPSINHPEMQPFTKLKLVQNLGPNVSFFKSLYCLWQLWTFNKSFWCGLRRTWLDAFRKFIYELIIQSCSSGFACTRLHLLLLMVTFE